MESTIYGSLLKRVKAVFIDILIIVGMGLLAATLLSRFDDAPDSIRLISFLLVFFLYDPICTSLIGGTIGHIIMGLRVRQGADELKRIIFPLAIIRFIFKAFLGWISLLTVSNNKKSKAIHDSIVNSVVIQL